MAKPNDAVVVTLPDDVGSRVRAVAEAEHRTPDEVVAEACRAHLSRPPDAARDEQYQEGYRRMPEDPAEVNAALSIIPVPPEDWS